MRGSAKVLAAWFALLSRADLRLGSVPEDAERLSRSFGAMTEEAQLYASRIEDTKEGFLVRSGKLVEVKKVFTKE